MEVHEIINNLDKDDVLHLLNLVLKKAKKADFGTLEADFTEVKKLDENEQIEFGRLLIGIIASQDNELGKYTSDKIKKKAIDSNKRGASSVAIDIIMVSAVLIPLIQGKIKIQWSKGKKPQVKLEYGGNNLLKIIKELTSPIDILASKIKKLSLGNLEIEGEEDKEKNSL